MSSRSVLTFACPACRRTFQIPESVIPPEGARGRCRGCGAQVQVFLDGRADLLSAPQPISPESPKSPSVPAPPTPPAAPDPAEEACWYVRIQDPKRAIGPGPYTLMQIREYILKEEIFEEDMGRVSMGPWMPFRSYPALEPFWSERNRSHREYHGDPLHCAIHPESAPGWLCPKCRSYLCVDCVENVPLLKGGAERMLCLACEFEAPPLAAAGVSNKKGLTALFKR